MARHGYSRTEEEEERSRKAAEELKAQAAEASRASGRREGGRGVPGSAMAESSARSKEWADEDRRTPLGPGQTRQSIHTFGPEGRGYASAVTTRPAPAAPAGQAVLGAAQKKVAAEGEKDARRLAYLRRLRPRKSRYLRGTVDDRKFGQQQRESRGRIDSEMARIQKRQERRRKEGRQDDLIQQQREAR